MRENNLGKYRDEDESGMNGGEKESDALRIGIAVALRLRLKPGQHGEHPPAERCLDLRQRKQQQPIGPVIQAERFGPVETSNQQIVGVACKIVDQIESGYAECNAGD